MVLQKAGLVLAAFIGISCILGSNGASAENTKTNSRRPIEYLPASSSPDDVTEELPIAPPQQPSGKLLIPPVEPQQGPYSPQGGPYMQPAGGSYMPQTDPYGGPYYYHEPIQQGPYGNPYMQQGPYGNPNIQYGRYEQYGSPYSVPHAVYYQSKERSPSESNTVDADHFLSLLNPQAFNNVKVKVG